MPRIFMSDTPEDHAAIQPALNQIQFYPLSQFDGNMKTKDWSKPPKMEQPVVPAKYSTTQPPWVDPGTFLIGSVLDAAAKDSEVMKTLQAAAFAADQELIAPLDAVAVQRPPSGRRLDLSGQ
jgi:hypothetical protein